MTKMFRSLAAAALLAAVLSGCASGPKYAEMSESIPTIKAGHGRVYFLRSSQFALLVQPEVYLNNQVVGRSRPGGFFFVDRPAGPYFATTKTETTMTINFSLNPGEVKYVRTDPDFGMFVGRIGFTLLDEAVAEEEMRDLSYTGRPLATIAK